MNVSYGSICTKSLWFKNKKLFPPPVNIAFDVAYRWLVISYEGLAEFYFMSTIRVSCHVYTRSICGVYTSLGTNLSEIPLRLGILVRDTTVI